MAEKKRELFAFRFYIDDFVGGTENYTDEEVGCYLRLLLHQFRYGYVDEKRLPRISDSVQKNWQTLKEKFKIGEDGYYRQHRMEQTRLDVIKKSEQQTEKVNNRWKKEREKLQGNGNTDVDTNVDTTVIPQGSGSGSIKDDDNKGGVGEKEEEGKNTPKSDSQKYYQQSICDEQWMIAVYRATKREFAELPRLIAEFNTDVIAREEFHHDLSRWRSHCVSWIKKQPKDQNHEKGKKGRKHIAAVPAERA